MTIAQNNFFILTIKLWKMRTIDKIILHCTASTFGKNFTVANIDVWHKARNFKKQKSGHYCGYHYVIWLDGTIEQGRTEDEVGAHCKGYNAHSIGIATVGGVDEKMNPLDTRTEPQKIALYTLVKTLLEKYNLTIEDVYCHNQFANKACPSYSIKQFKEEYKHWLEDKK